jgi:two-component system, NarL family, invasion response regulator UvrY
MTRELRILIVDDHPIVRQGLRQTLADAADVREIGEADHGQQVIDLVRQSDWDAVVLDIGLPGRGGIEILKDIRRERPRLPVLILSMHAEDQYAIRALRAGAAGYLTKETAPEKLLEAIRKITTGGRFISAALAERLALQLTSDATESPHASLSDREFEVLRLIGSGLSVGDIADRLSLSVKTVSTYRARILDKMRMKNNAELMQYVLTNRLLGDRPQ